MIYRVTLNIVSGKVGHRFLEEKFGFSKSAAYQMVAE